MLLQLRFVAAAAILLVIYACDAPKSDAPGNDVAVAEWHKIEFIVKVPEDTLTLYLTGNVAELGPWEPDALAMTGEGRERRATLKVPTGFKLAYKFTLGGWEREALDASGLVPSDHTLTVIEDDHVSHEITAFKQNPEVYMADWQNSGVRGTLIYWQDVASTFLTENRHVEVWLPPGYQNDPERRYRVIYMHDGQNLFDPRIANTGTDWGVDEAMTRGMEAGLFDPAIVVAAWSTSDRVPEYSPWHDAPQYARFLIEELMPRVNADFRTLTGPTNTFAMGSSMGGLLSFYLVKEHAEVFSACGCVSTHFPFSDDNATPNVVRDIAEGDTVPKGTRFFFDYGTETLDAEYGPPHAVVREWLLGQGMVESQDFVIREYPGASHNEASWRARLDDQLMWLLADDAN